MSKVKFHNDCQVGEHIFTRNSIWDFTDKYMALIGGCYTECPEYGYMYRIQTDYGILEVDQSCVVEIDYIINKDYTEEEWEKFITDDALVEDGDYVKAWINTFGINKPVKDRADQCDYNGDWVQLQKQIDDKYGEDGGFEK